MFTFYGELFGTLTDSIFLISFPLFSKAHYHHLIFP